MGVEKTEVVWFDGELIPWDDAQVHVLTHTLHYGLGVFEGTRVYELDGGGHAAFRLDDHLRRLQDSARIVQLDLPHGVDELRRASLELVERSGLASCYIRHIAFLGDGSMGLYPTDNPVHTAVVVWPWGAYLGEEGMRNGIRCKVSSYSRHFPNAAMLKAKATGNYINSILAKREAVADGFDEAILLDTEGHVSEGSGENIFLVRDGILKTPPTTSILAGITRATVLELARRKGLPTREVHSTRDELYTADEVFLTGTAAEITPVREVDRRPVGSGRPGPVTLDLQQEFFRVVRGQVPELAGWLTPCGETETVAAS